MPVSESKRANHLLGLVGASSEEPSLFSSVTHVSYRGGEPIRTQMTQKSMLQAEVSLRDHGDRATHASQQGWVLRLDFEELELELIQTQMTQKPMLRAEVYARALRGSQNREESRHSSRAWLILAPSSRFFAHTLLPAALASVSFGFVLVRVRVRALSSQAASIIFSNKCGSDKGGMKAQSCVTRRK
jgi:hypothetical protein